MKEYMLRALELAKKGAGNVSPNPVVGAVIVKNGKIIGEGWHQKYGSNHAEVNAFESCKEDTEGAEMYVTLEPCSHYGHTPPCAKTIIDHKIKRVYVGLTDPNPKVGGNGIKMLKEAGIEVIENYCEEECREANQIFLKYITTGMPYIVMKYAMTLDGKIAAYTGDSKWVSNEYSRNMVQKLRNDLKGIMVGVNTVLKDNPQLTCRLDHGINPVRIVLDSKLQINENAKVLGRECIIATTDKADRNKIDRIKNTDTKIIECPENEYGVDLGYLFRKLGELKIDSILIEGGGTLNYSALSQGLVDKVIAFIAPKLIGGKSALTPVEGIGFDLMSKAVNLNNIITTNIANDICITGYLRGY